MSRAREWMLNAATVLVTVLALVLGGHRVWENFLKPDPNAPRRVAGWKEYGREGHRLGSPDAAVTIVEFADFQCPFCRRAAEELDGVLSRYPNDVALVFRHYPLRIHTDAMNAARAAECAADTGVFWAFHDLLFAQTDSIGGKPWRRFAEDAGVTSLQEFEECASQSRPVSAVERDSVAASTLGITGTPLLLINDLRVAGYPGEGVLEGYVRDELTRIRQGHER